VQVQTALAVFGQGHLKAIPAQIGFENIGAVGVVFDNEDTFS
jgi:hypothetical protein